MVWAKWEFAGVKILGVKSLEDLIALYQNSEQLYTKEEFIEDIKKCKGK